MNTFFRATALCVSLCVGGAVVAGERGTADEAVNMVHKVIADMKSGGKDKVIAEINTMGSRYRDRDLYVTVLDMKGKELAHGSNRRMQGVDLFEMKDQDGKAYIKERLALAKANGKGWQDYKFVNPVSKNLEQKSMYFETYQDVIVNCGIYKQP